MIKKIEDSTWQEIRDALTAYGMEFREGLIDELTYRKRLIEMGFNAKEIEEEINSNRFPT